jgi:hypothetical protein
MTLLCGMMTSKSRREVDNGRKEKEREEKGLADYGIIYLSRV